MMVAGWLAEVPASVVLDPAVEYARRYPQDAIDAYYDEEWYA